MILNSILDNDLYKFTMQNAVIKLFPYSKARYKFINRGNTQFPEGFDNELRKHISAMSSLALTTEEKLFLEERCYYLDPTYLDFLRGYQYDQSEVTVIQNAGELQISIEGYWYRTILWEVPLMALVSELYFKMTNQTALPEKEIIEIVRNKAVSYRNMAAKVADFGTRRRYSFDNHDLVVRELVLYCQESFIGTSNVYFAMKYDLKPIGTHAHEWFMFHSTKYGFKMANKLALDNWVHVYRGDLGIALSDTFTTDVFFRAFDKKFTKLFDGVRHDSGDPIVFTDKTIAHYNSMRIDPMSKTIIFSDGLNPKAVESILSYCRGKIGVSFGIGTNFTNDVGVKPLNIVIKLTEAKPEGQEWENAVKLSDATGKYTGENHTIQLCKNVLKITD